MSNGLLYDEMTPKEQEQCAMDDRISDFLRNRMSDEEALAFRKELRKDEELRERAKMMALFAKEMKSIYKEDYEQLKNRMKWRDSDRPCASKKDWYGDDINPNLFYPGNNIGIRGWLWIIVVVGFFGLLSSQRGCSNYYHSYNMPKVPQKTFDIYEYYSTPQKNKALVPYLQKQLLDNKGLLEDSAIQDVLYEYKKDNNKPQK